MIMEIYNFTHDYNDGFYGFNLRSKDQGISLYGTCLVTGSVFTMQECSDLTVT